MDASAVALRSSQALAPQGDGSCRGRQRGAISRIVGPPTPSAGTDMTFPRASTALSRFTVLDLTRVRAGPTCVRQLADWGANCIKIEMPEHMADAEGMGGPREGPD